MTVSIQELAAQQGIQAIELDPGVWMFDAADDMGDWMEAEELDKVLAAGRLQAHISARV